MNGKRYRGPNHQGADRSAPYPLSRLAPAVELVDLAQEIARADEVVAARANAELRLIAEQIRALQQRARQVLEEAERDQALHRVRCHCRRIPGKVYHLYERPDGERYFSLLSPEDWGGAPPHQHCGAYRLEADMRWVALDD